MSKSLHFLLVGVLGSVACSASATLLHADSFESYSVGTGLSDNGYTAPYVYTVSDARSFSGTQSGTRDLADSGEVGTKVATKYVGYVPTSPADSIVTVRSMVYMGSGQASNTTAGVVAYEVDGRLIGQATILSGGNLNLTTGAYNRVTPTAVAALDTWHEVTMEIDLYLSRVRVLLNGQELDPLDVPINANLDEIGEVGLLSRRGSDETQSDVYWDDLSVEAVPEPATMLAFAAFAPLLMKRRKMQSS